MSNSPRYEPLIEFEPAMHAYYLDGRRFSHSVTEVLTGAGFYNPEYFTDEQRERGRAVHEITAEFDHTGRTDLRRVPEKYRGYVRAWEQYKRDSQIECFQHIEQIVICPELDYAGTLDRGNPVIRKGGSLVIVDEIDDIKTNERGMIYSPVRIQLVGYGYARHPRHICRRRAVCLRPNGEYTTAIYSPSTWQADLAEWVRALDRVRGVECHHQESKSVM